MTDITTVASPATAQPAVPPILFTKDLPGPLSLNRLAAFGTLRKLDDSAGYWIEHSGTLYGRAKIVAEVAPFGTVVCSMTAAWVWLGGPDFPSTIDVISTSHFRSASVSRRIRVFKRLTLPEQIIKLGGLPVTTPARTACDLVMSPEDIPDSFHRQRTGVPADVRVPVSAKRLSANRQGASASQVRRTRTHVF